MGCFDPLLITVCFVILDKGPDFAQCGFGLGDISGDAAISELFGAQKQDIRFIIGLLSENLAEIFLIRITDHDKFLSNIQIFVQTFVFSLKIALTALIKYEIIGTWIITVVRDHKIDKIASADVIQQAVFRVLDMRTCLVGLEALIAAAAAGLDPVLGEPKNSTVLIIRCDIIADLIAVSAGAGAEGN